METEGELDGGSGLEFKVVANLSRKSGVAFSGRSGSRGGPGGRSGCRRQLLLPGASGEGPRKKYVKENLQEIGDLGGSDQVRIVIFQLFY